MKQKPILILVDEDYEPSRATALDDVLASLEFHEIGATIGEIDYLPEETQRLCQVAIDRLISAPLSDKDNIAILPALELLGKLQKALEDAPAKPARGEEMISIIEQAHALIGEALIDGIFPEDGEPGMTKRKDAEAVANKMLVLLLDKEAQKDD